jgi:hypothetical protein
MQPVSLSPLTLWSRILLRWCVLDTTLCDKSYHWLAGDRWFSPGSLVACTNNIYRHDIAEILLKVALNTIIPYYCVVSWGPRPLDHIHFLCISGADAGFQARRAHLRKLRRAEGGAKIVGVFRVKNHDFTPKNLIFSIAEGGAKIFGVFRVKNHDFTPIKSYFFQF